MPRIAARLAVVVLALAVSACGGDGNGSDEAEHRGIQAFPDVLEIARAELGDGAVLSEVSVSETRIALVNVEFGRTTRVTYNAEGVFVGNARARPPRNAAQTFQISDVPADAPANLLAAVQEREDGTVSGFEARLARDRRGELVWNAKASVDGSPKEYEAALDGSLRG